MSTFAVHVDEGIHSPGPEITLRCEYGERRLWWGHKWQWASAAYWADQAARCSVAPGQFRLGTTLPEEVAACVLGGFGMPARTGIAAFGAIRAAGLIRPHVASADIEEVLRQPLRIGDLTVKYRFPRQRSERLAAALCHLHQNPVPDEPRAARDALLNVPGIGPKTASWIVRNHYDSDAVAILDVHLCRAGDAAGVFDRSWNLARDYSRYEAFFLAWARRAEVRASVLDACIWSELAELGSTHIPSRHA